MKMAPFNGLGWLLISYLTFTHLKLTPARNTKLSHTLQSFNGRDEFLVSKTKNLSKNRDGLLGPTESEVPVESGVGEVIAQKYFPMTAAEPSCEQLRAMWRFSKRQSRAAEMTNELPTYRDPFAFNVWDPFPSLGPNRLSSSLGDRGNLPVFGTVVNREPVFTQRINYSQRKPVYNGGESPSPRFYGIESKSSFRRPTQTRYIGGSNGSASLMNSGSHPENSAVQGSFQKLKELIWTERAKELTQQRRAEELAAKAAVLKEIANGQNLQSLSKYHTYVSDSPLMDENRSPDNEGGLILNENIKSQNNIKGQSQQNLKLKSSKHHQGGLAYGRFRFDRNHKSANMKDFIDSSNPLESLKSYPLRPSHFRERNRVLFNQPSQSEMFRRYARANFYGDFLDGNKNLDDILYYDNIKKPSLKLGNFLMRIKDDFPNYAGAKVTSTDESDNISAEIYA